MTRLHLPGYDLVTSHWPGPPLLPFGGGRESPHRRRARHIEPLTSSFPPPAFTQSGNKTAHAAKQHTLQDPDHTPTQTLPEPHQTLTWPTLLFCQAPTGHPLVLHYPYQTRTGSLASGLVTRPGVLPGFHRPIASQTTPNPAPNQAQPSPNHFPTTPKPSPNHPTISKPSQNHTETIPKAPQDLVTIPDPVTRLHGLAQFARYDPLAARLRPGC